MATIKDVRDALLTLDIPVYHFVAPEQKPDEFVIWGETSMHESLSADNKISWLKVSGQIWFYTDAEYSTTFAKLFNALNDADIGISVSNIGYDYDLRLLAYIVDWSVECGTSDIY